MASLSAKEAAEAVGMTKAGLLKAVRKGTLSAEKDHNGEWKIDPSELFRAYPPVNQNTGAGNQTVDNGTRPTDTGLQAEIEHLRALLERADQRAEEWKAVAEREGQERRQLMAMLTDQRAQDARRSIWAKLLGR